MGAVFVTGFVSVRALCLYARAIDTTTTSAKTTAIVAPTAMLDADASAAFGLVSWSSGSPRQTVGYGCFFDGLVLVP